MGCVTGLSPSPAPVILGAPCVLLIAIWTMVNCELYMTVFSCGCSCCKRMEFGVRHSVPTRSAVRCPRRPGGQRSCGCWEGVTDWVPAAAWWAAPCHSPSPSSLNKTTTGSMQVLWFHNLKWILKYLSTELFHLLLV
jgi:hypothetical protein